MSLEVAYVGSKGTHGFVGNGPNYDINPARVGDGATVTKAFLIGANGKPDTTQPCPLGATPNPTSTTPGVCGAASASFSAFTPQNQRRPLFPRIPFSLSNYYGNDAASTYNALEVKLENASRTDCSFCPTTRTPRPTDIPKITTTP